MDNIAYDVLKKFPLPPENDVWGEVRFSDDNIILHKYI